MVIFNTKTFRQGKHFQNFNVFFRLEAPASALGLSLDNLFTSAPGEQFATLLKQFEHEIIRLNSLIARNVERINTPENGKWEILTRILIALDFSFFRVQQIQQIVGYIIIHKKNLFNYLGLV